MHPSVMQFVAQTVHTHDLTEKNVLEIGSMNINGSVRRFFKGGTYLGTDMRPGPDVDLVINAHDLDMASIGVFDVVVCCEMLEHDDAPWRTLQNAHCKTDDGGYLILTARGFDERGAFPLHGYPDDHWRYTPSGLTSLLDYTGWKPEWVGRDPEEPGVFAVALATAS